MRIKRSRCSVTCTSFSRKLKFTVPHSGRLSSDRRLALPLLSSGDWSSHKSKWQRKHHFLYLQSPWFAIVRERVINAYSHPSPLGHEHIKVTSVTSNTPYPLWTWQGNNSIRECVGGWRLCNLAKLLRDYPKVLSLRGRSQTVLGSERGLRSSPYTSPYVAKADPRSVVAALRLYQ